MVVVGVLHDGARDDVLIGMCSVMSSSLGRPGSDAPPRERVRGRTGSREDELEGRERG